MKKKLLIGALTIMGAQLVQTSPLGLLKPYDFMIEPERNIGSSKFQITAMTETGYNNHGYDVDGNKVNALQIYEKGQNILGLFQGFGAASQFNQTVDALAGGAGGGVNNDQNGLFRPSGNMIASQIALSGSYQFYRDFFIRVHVPVYKIKLDTVTWKYAGNNTTFADAAIEEKLVRNFQDDAKKLFNLDTQGWSETHIGDMACMLDFTRDFPQGRQILRNVRSHLRVGLTLPTGGKSDENQLMSVPLGNDGSVSLPFGGGLDLNLSRYWQFGFRGNFEYFWGHEKKRRVKTFARQTTLLFPQAVDTFKNFGFVQKFNLYGQLFNLVGGCSLKVAYEYTKKSQDSLSVRESGFNYELVNTALDLEEKTSHFVLLMLNHDSGFTQYHGKMHPQFTAFVKIPCNGSYTNLATTFGLQATLEW